MKKKKNITTLGALRTEKYKRYINILLFIIWDIFMVRVQIYLDP